MKTNIEIINSLVSDEVSGWMERAEFRIKNKHWLDKSARIALKILRHLRKSGITQKELAEMINVSPQYINKIVKGSENLTLQTISSIEIALGISLIEVLRYNNTTTLNVAEDIKSDNYTLMFPIPSIMKIYDNDSNIPNQSDKDCA